MKVAILHPSDEGSTAPFADLDPPRDPTRYLDGPEYSHVWIAKATAVRQVIEVAQAGFDVIINLCDGAWDEDRPGIEVVDALERLNVAFTGAGRSFYDPSRTAMKMAAHGGGVRVPAFVTAKDHDGVREAVARLRFPMMVKHPRGYSSVGISKDSRVDGVDGLTVQVARTLNAFGGALIEEFVEGREFTVLVTEPRLGDSEPWTFTPVEFVFPPGESFKHFDLKWRNHGDMTMRLVREEPLATRLREAASLTFEALEGDGFARCDLRMDAAGEIFMLEINPNCGVFYPEGAFAGADSHCPPTRAATAPFSSICWSARCAVNASVSSRGRFASSGTMDSACSPPATSAKARSSFVTRRRRLRWCRGPTSRGTGTG